MSGECSQRSFRVLRRAAGDLVVHLAAAEVLDEQHEVSRRLVERGEVALGCSDGRAISDLLVEPHLPFIEPERVTDAAGLGQRVRQLQHHRRRTAALGLVPQRQSPQQREDPDPHTDRLRLDPDHCLAGAEHTGGVERVGQGVRRDVGRVGPPQPFDAGHAPPRRSVGPHGRSRLIMTAGAHLCDDPCTASVTLGPMCGRFVSAAPPDQIARYFHAERVSERVVEPHFNVAPTTDVYVVLEDAGARTLDAYHWGLIPFWAKDPTVGNRMINARAEGLAGKGAYKHAFRHRRCLVPADGFYEWKRVPGQRKKQPYYIHRSDGEPLALAGLWEKWRGPDGQAPSPEDSAPTTLHSCTIVTTDANEIVSELHDRMPVILPPSAWDAWLDPGNADLDQLNHLLVPAPSSLLVMHPVGTDVSDVRNDGAHLIDPVAEEFARSGAGETAVQGTLL